jgi:hypothetical protein
MLRLIRRRDQERGAIAVIVALVVGTLVLTGVAALTVDAGSLYAERRVVQNAADAASLELAAACARNDVAKCSVLSASMNDLTSLANLNSPDGFTDIDSVCGSTAPFANCGALPPSPTLVQCTNLPPAMASAKWVEVRTKTHSTGAGNSSVVHKVFANLSDPSYDGIAVKACARAAWGPPSSGSPTIPVTISACDWNNLTANGTSLIAPGPYNDPFQSPDLFPGIAYPSPGPLVYESRILLHDTTGSTHCPAGPSGADLPGGFGWLATSAGCSLNVSATGWVNDAPGNSPPGGCDLAPLVGQTAYIPIFGNTNALTGSNGQYLLDGFAAFYFTGYSIPSDRPKSIATNVKLCTASQTCLYGWFTSGVIPRGSFGGGGGTPRGAIAVGVAG